MTYPAQKPRLSFWQIWNMSFGFLGIQFGFALQNSNASRILQTFGADVEHLSLFWLAAPITGMLVQPLIGHYSDRTWTRLGRRRPFFLAGAVLAALALVLLPNSDVLMTTVLPPLWIGAGMLMIMDASFNVAMEPFRALVADNLPDEQRSLGFSLQTFLIGVGAVLGSWLPYLLSEHFGISKTAGPGEVPDNVIFSFYAGAFVLLLSLMWTVIRTREYSPEELRRYDPPANDPSEAGGKGLSDILVNFVQMPKTMKQLGLVQFFSWLALFLMWVFMTPAIAQHIYRLEPGDTTSADYADAANWVGILFGTYNAVSALYALCLPLLSKRLGRKATHAFSLAAGGAGLASFYFISDPDWLLLSMTGVGFAWGSILAMPYALLASSIASNKMGVSMGIFNFFITFPQIIGGFFGGFMVKILFDGQAIFAIVMAGVFMAVGALAVLRVKESHVRKVSM